MGRLVPRIDGYVRGSLQFTVDEAADLIADAHRAGERWTCFVASSSDQTYRPMDEAESAELVAAVTERLR